MILYQLQQNNKMSRHTRVYESGQVQFENCTCITQYLQKDEDPSLINIRVRRNNAGNSNCSNIRGSQKIKAVGLRLSKNIPLIVQSCNKDKNRSKLTQINPQNPHTQNQQPILKIADKTIYHQQMDPQNNIYGTIVQSRLIKNECLNKKSSHIENDRKLVYKKQMKETGLFNDSPYVSTHVAGNVQSTSSTTLYETKLNLEEVVDRDGQGKLRSAGREIKNQMKQVQNSSRILFSITDFSRVRKVQTVLSEQSDSLDISFLDLGSQLQNEELQQMQNEIKLGQIHNEIKKLLKN